MFESRYDDILTAADCGYTYSCKSEIHVTPWRWIRYLAQLCRSDANAANPLPSSVTDLSKRGHRLQAYSFGLPSQGFSSPSRATVDFIEDNRHSNGFCLMEGAVKKRVRLRAQLGSRRAVVDADRTALQPDCRKGHSCLHMATLLYVTLQMESFDMSNISTEIHRLGILTC
jgi:hypothetical protein